MTLQSITAQRSTTRQAEMIWKDHSENYRIVEKRID